MKDINSEIAEYVAREALSYSDNIAFLVEVETGKTFFYRNDFIEGTNKDGRSEFNYSEIIEIVKNKIIWEQKENVEHRIPLSKIIEELEKVHRYEFDFFDFDLNGEIHKKRFIFFYADKSKKKIVGMIQDIHRQYMREMHQLDRITDERNKLVAFQSSFLSGISQEVRNPLNVMLGLAALVKSMAGENSEIRKYIDQITAGGQHIVTMVTNMLDGLNIQNGVFMLNKKPARISRIMEFVHNAFNPECASRNIVFDTIYEKQDPVLMVDVKRGKQLLVTIIQACLYMAKPEARISMTYSSEEEGNIVHGKFELRDTNKKISDEVKRALLAEDDSELMSIRFTGKGISLIIFKKLLKKANGRLEIENEDGNNVVRFFVDFEKCQEEKKSVNDASVLMGKRILIVDDHPMNVQIVEALLKSHGVQTESAENGLRALELFENSDLNYYDAVLMDIKMPVMDGHEASKKIRMLKRPDAVTVPIFAMTANVQDMDREKSFASGMNEHLEKPFDPEDMIQLLVNFLTD